MTVVCDMGPLQYLILIGRDHMLPLVAFVVESDATSN